MRTFGDPITDQTIDAKVLHSLTPRFDHIVAAIEQSKDLTTLTTDEVSGPLQAHEARLNQSREKSEEIAFQVKSEGTGAREFSRHSDKGCGIDSYRVRSRGRGKRWSVEQKATHNDYRQHKGSI